MQGHDSAHFLKGLDGRKMSKTYGNTINLTDPPNEMYGKLMSLKDELIIDYFKLCTDLPLAEILEMERSLERKELNPREAKARLAKEITTIYHGKKQPERPRKNLKEFSKRKSYPLKFQNSKFKKRL